MKKFQCEEINFEVLYKQGLLETLSIKYILQNKQNLVCYTDDPKNPRGILIKSGYLHYAYSKNLDFINELIDHFNHPGAYGFAGISRVIADLLRDQYQVEWSNSCRAYTHSKDHYHPEKQVHETAPLGLEDAEMVDDHYPYSGDHTLKMIRDDIQRRPSAAVFIDGEPVAWALQHPDGTIGMMHTLEEHRHKGYARDTTFGMIKALLAQDEIPIVQIAESNTVSQALAKVCGFQPFGTADWFGIVVK